MPDLTIPGEYAVALGLAFTGMGYFIKWLVARLITVVEDNTRAMTDLAAQVQAANRVQEP